MCLTHLISCRLNQYDGVEEFLVVLKESGERTQERLRSETQRSRSAMDQAGSKNSEICFDYFRNHPIAHSPGFRAADPTGYV